MARIAGNTATAVCSFKDSGLVDALGFSPDGTKLYAARRWVDNTQATDFVTAKPKAALVLSPLSKEHLGREWFFNFLIVALGNHLHHKQLSESSVLLKSFTDSGLDFALMPEVELGRLKDPEYCESAATRAFPSLMSGFDRRVVIMHTVDVFPGHSDAPTTVAWVFPRFPGNMQIWDTGSLALQGELSLRYDEGDASAMGLQGSIISSMAAEVFEGNITDVPLMAIFGLDISPDGQLIALACGYDVKLFRLERGTILPDKFATLRSHRDDVNSVSFSHDGSLIVSGSADGTVILWDVSSKSMIKTFGAGKIPLGSAMLTPDNTLLIAGGGTPSSGGYLFVWSVMNGACLRRINDFEPTGLRCVDLSPSALTVAYPSRDGSISILELSSGNVKKSPRGLGEVAAVFYHPDGQHLVVCSNTVSRQIGDLASVVSDSRVTICGPGLEAHDEVYATKVGIVCAAASPSRDEVAVGFGDNIRLIRLNQRSAIVETKPES